MYRKAGRIDKTLAFLIAILVVAGCMIFASAAFGLLARGSSHITSVAFNHLVLGVLFGIAALCVTTFIDYRAWRKYAPYIFAAALALTALVFVPGIGFEHGGGKRWLHILGVSLQPSEFLKVAVLVMAAAYFSAVRNLVGTWRWGMGGFLGVLALPVAILVLQPDLGTLGVTVLSVFSIYFASGARAHHVLIVFLIGILALGTLAIYRPYVRDRITTFLDPSQGQQAEGYQIRQSLIAIGSGGLLGRGFGQGIQKFTYLPEPMGDSIFAVAAEELGFVGAVTLIGIYLSFALRAYHVATRAADQFGALLAIGIATYLACEAFINIAAMLGMAPLTGIPLTFISQGGSAMLASLAAAGILLSISRFRVRRSS